MAGIFEDINLFFNGQAYVVKADKVNGLIDTIEEHVKMFDLVNPQYLRNMRLAKAYHAALVYAGAECGLDEVYDSLFDGDEKHSVITRINGLFAMMVPPQRMRDKNTKKKAKGSQKTFVWFGLLILALSVTAGFIALNFGLFTL